METSKSLAEEPLQALGRHAHWLLRLSLLGVFTYHGIDKFMGGGITEFATIMQLPWLIALLVALTEIAAGVLVVVGGLSNAWVTRLGALLVIPIMFGAIIMEHWGQWHFMATPTHPLGGMQFQFTLLMIAFYLLIRGNAR